LLFVMWAIKWLLSLVFLVAAFAKFADLPGSRRAVQGFGVAKRFADVIGTALPVAELAVGVALLFTRTAWWGATGATLLLTCFVLAIGANLLRGKTPDCHCFGQLHSAPAGPKTLIRNVVLAVLAGLVVARGQHSTSPGITEFLTALSGVQIVWAAATSIVLCICAASTWFMLELYKQSGRLLQRIEALERRVAGETTQVGTEQVIRERPSVGLRPGLPAPEFELIDLEGETRSLRSLLSAPKPLMLLFTDPECGPCQAMLPAVATWYAESAEILKLVMISRGGAKENLKKFGSQRLPDVLLQQDREVATAFQCYGTPGAVLVGSDGTIKSYVAQGSIEIEKMFVEERKRATPELRSAHQIGDRAPEFVLPNASGKQAKLADFLGRALVLLFWNPSCGFCLRMLEDLRSWERRSTSGVPRLLVVSTGSAEVNRQMGLLSEVLLDDDFRVGRAFRATGTPSAVLLDKRGIVSAPLATGEDAVRSLLGFENLAGTVANLEVTASAGISGEGISRRLKHSAA